MTRPSGRSPELVAKAPAATTAIRVLGPLEVLRDGQGIRLGSAQRRLLAVLLTHANEIVSTDRLRDALWGKGSRAPEAGARSTSVARLQSSVSRLRSALGHARLQTHPAGYRFVVERDELDAFRFENLVQVGLTSTDRPMTALQAFDDALALWRGAPYPEFDAEEFAAPEIARLVALQARAVAGRAAAHAAVARLTPKTDSFDAPLPPTGTLTFLFTDVEGSTRLWEDHPQAMQGALARHDELLRDAIEAHDGRIVKMRGDGVHGVFATAHSALEAALAAQRALCSERWGATGALRVRIAVHTGEAEHRAGDYYGTAVNRAARLMGIGHGQQVLVSHATEQIVGDALPPGLQLVDLGEHRLPDLATVERVFQVVHPELPARFPPLRAVDVSVSLAVPATSFHGRAHELDALADLASQPGTVTLVGPGGVGKTRLALELSTEVGHRFRDGVRFIDLTPVVADAVPATFAAGLGLVRRGRRSFHDSIVGWLGRKHILLLVDNCEHVLDRVAPLLRDIGEASSQVTVLCTSRQPLGFPGEVVYSVEPLGLPSSDDPSTIESSPAVRLFVDRASAARYDLQLPPEELAVVAQICRRLDGIPLAVELAAARAGSMSSQDLLANLDPRSPILAMRTPDHPRHRTLFSAIEWSYDLLSPESRALFERLSVFAGSWTVQAARRICTDRTSDNDVLALLADLVDRSMIVADVGQRATRYRMLSTLRDFAADRLPDDAAMAELTARHARYYCDLAAAAEPGLRTSDEARWVAEITADLGNLHAAHRWALDHRDIDLDARLLAALWNYGLQHLSAEYFRWVEEALAVLSFEDHPLVAELHGIAALGAWLRGDLRQSIARVPRRIRRRAAARLRHEPPGAHGDRRGDGVRPRGQPGPRADRGGSTDSLHGGGRMEPRGR